MNRLRLLVITLFAFCALISQQGFAVNHFSETTKPIIAQYFGIWTERGQAWEDKFREDTPFTKLNRLYLTFGKIINKSDHHHWVQFDGHEQRALAVIERVRKVNPDAEIFVVIGGNGDPTSYGGASRDPKFAGNVLAFLQKYDLDGVDVDWEEGLDKEKLSSLLTSLYNTLHPAGFKLTFDAWQYVSPAYDIPYIRDYVDQINLMSFGTGISLNVCVSDYIHSGLPASKIIGGIESETGYNQFGGITDTLGMAGSIERKARFAKDMGLAGMMARRLDNDYAAKSSLMYPTYKGAIALWDEMMAPRSHSG